MLKEKVIKEMVKEAAKEINYVDHDGAYNLLIQTLFIKYDISIEKEPLSWQLMSIVSAELDEWQCNAELNCVS